MDWGQNPRGGKGNPLTPSPRWAQGLAETRASPAACQGPKEGGRAHTEKGLPPFLAVAALTGASSPAQPQH